MVNQCKTSRDHYKNFQKLFEKPWRIHHLWRFDCDMLDREIRGKLLKESNEPKLPLELAKKQQKSLPKPNSYSSNIGIYREQLRQRNCSSKKITTQPRHLSPNFQQSRLEKRQWPCLCPTCWKIRLRNHRNAFPPQNFNHCSIENHFAEIYRKTKTKHWKSKQVNNVDKAESEKKMATK